MSARRTIGENTMNRVRAFGCCITLVISTTGANAHHSFAAVHDGTKTITIEGVVSQFRFMNPHSLLSVEVAESDGKRTTWTIELSSSVYLSENGWTARAFKAGERVKVTGNPAHKGNSEMFFRSLIRADGTEVRSLTEDRTSAIEAARKERARLRNGQK